MEKIFSLLVVFLFIFSFMPLTTYSQVGLECLGSISGVGDCSKMVVDGDYVYITSEYGGLKIINVTNPERPEIVDTILNGMMIRLIEVKDQIAFITVWSENLINIYDISDINDINYLGTISEMTHVEKYYQYSNLLIVNTQAHLYDQSVYLYDITNPGSPRMISNLNEMGLETFKYPYIITTTVEYNPEDYWSQETYHLYDVSNPFLPTKLSELGNGDYDNPYSDVSYECKIIGDYVLKEGNSHNDMGDDSDFHYVYNISNPTNPEIIIENDYAFIGTYYIKDNYVLSYSHDCELVIYNYSDPENPTIDYTWTWEDEYWHFSDIRVSEGLIFIVESTFWPENLYRMDVIEGNVIPGFNNEEEINILSYDYKFTKIYPNPFNPTLNVGISLSSPSDLKVQVYNINGRLVETLTDGRYSAGDHNLIFNGNGLSSGVYFINAVVPGEMNQTRKVTLVK